MPALPRLRLAEVAQREDGLYSFHLAARWGVMDSRLSSGLRFWLSLPGWLLLVAQGLGIGALALLGGGWMLQDEWRQRESAAERQQRLLQQIAMVQRQLDEVPQTAIPAAPLAPIATGDLASVLQRAGAPCCAGSGRKNRRGKR